MRKCTFWINGLFCLVMLGMLGCGGAEKTVIDGSAIPNDESEVPVAGMSEEEYAKEMQKQSSN